MLLTKFLRHMIVVAFLLLSSHSLATSQVFAQTGETAETTETEEMPAEEMPAEESTTESVTFTLTNGTSQTIDMFYASPPSENSWEEDILGVDVLPPGETVTITIDDSREDCAYDFKAVFEDGTELAHSAVEVCNGESYVYEE